MKTLRNKISELLQDDVLEVLCGARSFSDDMHDEINQHKRSFSEWLNYEEMYNSTSHNVSSCENKKWFGITYTKDTSYGSRVKRFIIPVAMMDYEVESNRHAVRLFFKYLKEI